MSFSCDNEPACKEEAEHRVFSEYHGRHFWFCARCQDNYTRVFEDKQERQSGPQWPRADTEPIELNIGRLF